MKKVLVVAALAMTLVVATACSGGQPSGNSGSSSGGSSNPPAESQSSSSGSDVKSADQTNNSSSSSGNEDLTALASKFTEAYMGVTENGETMYYAGNADGSLAVLVFYDVATNKNVSFVGPAKADGNAITISDAQNGLSFTFTIEAAEDGGIVIDTGDSGKAVLAECDVMEVLKAMQSINDYSTAIA